MDASLKNQLKTSGVTDDTLSVLVGEEIKRNHIFYTVREEHFQQLLPKVKVGQHALLLSLHQEKFEVSTDCLLEAINQYFMYYDSSA